ncbi:hypothetical protein [Dolichospermum flos-aquae]|uniref:Uncharacterized protein n=1 Tax=Dolichospermum flos-aquae CCAP 1403/13F TaxID=315271 RepID=A0A6H2BV93_DOLFA|nr:hypothetical protein [Dolichospermum flos-aquae]QJB42858.1 hypothetical protein HGD76_19325 [Dolichospermum flos-aquae CCAP 1403/13F]
MLVGAKHLQDKLSVIAKNSSPNASPVQLSVVSSEKLPITHYPLLILYFIRCDRIPNLQKSFLI